jgi:hypothetical protein
MKWVVYGGLASRRGIFNDSLYDETGVDGRSVGSEGVAVSTGIDYPF